LFRPTLDRFPDDGLGVLGRSGKRLAAAVAARGPGDPKDDLLAPLIPPATAFCRRGLPAGE